MYGAVVSTLTPRKEIITCDEIDWRLFPGEIGTGNNGEERNYD
jgi:hypothetical protein